MRESNINSIRTRAKQALAWALSIQIAGLSYVIPALTFFSQTAMTSVAEAGTDGPIDVNPPSGSEIKSETEKVASPPPAPYLNELGHGDNSTRSTPAQRKPLCKDENGKWKKGCIIAGIILGVGAVIALIALTRKRGKRPPMRVPKPGKKPNKPRRPTETPTPLPPDAPPVDCCNNPAPAPAPDGGGVTETSTVTTGNTLPDGVDPIVVNP